VTVTNEAATPGTTRVPVAVLETVIVDAATPGTTLVPVAVLDTVTAPAATPDTTLVPTAVDVTVTVESATPETVAPPAPSFSRRRSSADSRRRLSVPPDSRSSMGYTSVVLVMRSG
jgi:hypothetical protein